MLPDSEVLGVTEATGICGMEAEEKVEYEDAQEVMGEEEEVTGEFFSRLGEFSHALRADSIWGGDRKKRALRSYIIEKKSFLEKVMLLFVCLPLVLGQQ